MMSNQLKKKLLTSTRTEFVEFISENFDFYNGSTLEEIKEKKDKLYKLDLDTIKHTSNRVNSLKGYYDLSQGFPFLAPIIVFIIAFIVKDYFQLMLTPEDLKKMSLAIGLMGILICLVLCKVCFTVFDKTKHRSYILKQFEGILEEIKEIIEVEQKAKQVTKQKNEQEAEQETENNQNPRNVTQIPS